MGRGIRAENIGVRVFGDQRSDLQRAFPLFHQGSGAGHVLQRDYRLPHGRRRGNRPSRAGRGAMPDTYDRRSAGIFGQAGALRQNGRSRTYRTRRPERRGGQSPDAVGDDVLQQALARHAADKSRVCGFTGQQGQPQCRQHR